MAHAAVTTIAFPYLTFHLYESIANIRAWESGLLKYV